MACVEEHEDTATFFGLAPTDLFGKTGYADFLSSIADNPFVFRDEIMPTDDFIDSVTQDAQVVLVFFTPRTGLVTGEHWPLSCCCFSSLSPVR